MCRGGGDAVVPSLPASVQHQYLLLTLLTLLSLASCYSIAGTSDGDHSSPHQAVPQYWLGGDGAEDGVLARRGEQMGRLLALMARIKQHEAAGFGQYTQSLKSLEEAGDAERAVAGAKRGFDFGFNRGHSGNKAGKHMMGLAAAQSLGSPGR